MLWACVLLPHLALDAIVRRVPDPDAPLVLIDGPAQQRTVHSVNAAAAAAGLRPGQRLVVAQALLSQFAAIPFDPVQTAHWHRFLAAWAYRYSSQVSADAPKALLIEVRGSFGVHGPWPRIEARLREELAALGFRHRLGLAPTPRAALVFAGLRDGLAVMSEVAMREALAGVPVRAAALPGECGTRLHGMGLRTLGALIQAPRDSLRRRFGEGLLDHLDRLYGDVEDMPALYQPPDHFDARVEFSYEVENHQALQFPLRRLTGDLATYLAGRDGGVQRFVVRLEHAGRHTDVPVGLLVPERDAKMLFDLALNRLERATIPAPILAMRLLARELPPFVPASRDLFDTRPAQAVPWPQLRERLRARLGDEAVYRIAPANDPRPECAWMRTDSDPPSAPKRPPRPIWLLPKPVPLRDSALRILAGPERLESGWWDGKDARRDYYVLETSQGQHAWAFAPVGEQGPWMLHGWFA